MLVCFGQQQYEDIFRKCVCVCAGRADEDTGSTTDENNASIERVSQSMRVSTALCSTRTQTN